MMNIEKMKEVLSDEAFFKSLFELETVAEVQAALREKGVELSEDEILGVRELFLKVEGGEISAEQLEKWVEQAESGELSEELLEQVSGGCATLVAAAVVTFLIKAGTAAAVAGVIYGAAHAIKNRW